MPRLSVYLCLAALAAGLGGCSTVFHASAPSAQQGMEYVVGGRAGFFSGHRAVWLCPTGGVGGECQHVEIQD